MQVPRNGPVGSALDTPGLQVRNGTTRQVHGTDDAVILTNGRITPPAVQFAAQQRLHVVDRNTLRPAGRQRASPVGTAPPPAPATQADGVLTP